MDDLLEQQKVARANEEVNSHFRGKLSGRLLSAPSHSAIISLDVKVLYSNLLCKLAHGSLTYSQ